MPQFQIEVTETTITVRNPVWVEAEGLNEAREKVAKLHDTEGFSGTLISRTLAHNVVDFLAEPSGRLEDD